MLQVELIGVVVSLLSIVFGILILIFPKILNYLIAIYFIIAGIFGLITFIR